MFAKTMTKFAFRRPNTMLKMKIRLMSESNVTLRLFSNVGQKLYFGWKCESGWHQNCIFGQKWVIFMTFKASFVMWQNILSQMCVVLEKICSRICSYCSYCLFPWYGATFLVSNTKQEYSNCKIGVKYQIKYEDWYGQRISLYKVTKQPHVQ